MWQADAGRSEQLTAAEAERERFESLGRLASGVAHEFNNLLAVILNYTSLVAEEVAVEAERGDERWIQVRGDVEQIQRAGQRAVQLIHELEELTDEVREVLGASGQPAP